MPDDVRRLARELATTPRAVLYGRVGVCTQEFGGLCAWLLFALNALTGHLDEPGGVDVHHARPSTSCRMLAAASAQVGQLRPAYAAGSAACPSSAASCPVAALAEEIETPGPGPDPGADHARRQPGAVDPERRAASSARLPQLDFMVSIDSYLNETTRLAHVILPPTARSSGRTTTCCS